MKTKNDYFLNQEQLELATDPDKLQSYEIQLQSIKSKLIEWASDSISLRFQLKYKSLFFKLMDCEERLQVLLGEVYNGIDSDWIMNSYQQFEIQFEEVSRKFQEFSVLKYEN